MTTLTCYDPQGNPIPVLIDTLIYRPAVFGVCIEAEEILLLRDEGSPLLRLPGKIMLPGEAPIPVLRRYYRQLTGLTPLVGPLIHLQDLYRVDANGRAWHLSAMFYPLARPSATTTAFSLAEDGSYPELHLVETLSPGQLQFGYDAVAAALLRLKVKP